MNLQQILVRVMQGARAHASLLSSVRPDVLKPELLMRFGPPSTLGYHEHEGLFILEAAHALHDWRSYDLFIGSKLEHYFAAHISDAYPPPLDQCKAEQWWDTLRHVGLRQGLLTYECLCSM